MKSPAFALVGLLISSIALVLIATEPSPAAAKKPTANTPAAATKKVTAPASTSSTAANTTKAAASPAPDSSFPDKEFYTKAEVEALREVLDKKSTQLDQDIETQKKYLESLKAQTEDNLKKVEAARNEIADFMNTRDEKEEGKLKKLARFYEAMDAEQAAPLLKDVQDDLAIKIFDRMDTKKAGAILALMPPLRAARITSAFPKLKLQADRGPTGGPLK